MKKIHMLPLLAALLAGFAQADVQQDANDIARDAADIAKDTTDIQADRTALRADFAAMASLRAERRADEKALAADIAAGNLTAAQADLAKIDAVNASIKTEREKLTAAHKELSKDIVDRALDRADLNQDARDLARDSAIHHETVTDATLAADRAKLAAAEQAFASTLSQRKADMQAMVAAVRAGDLATAQKDLAAAKALSGALKSEAQAVAEAHHQLVNDRKAAIKAGTVAKASLGNAGEHRGSDKGNGNGGNGGNGGSGGSHGGGHGHK